MDDIQEMLVQAIGEMSPDRRAKLMRFIQLVTERDECALQIIRRIESGTLSPKDALVALDRCLEAGH
jgi:hypothetical protein